MNVNANPSTETTGGPEAAQGRGQAGGGTYQESLLDPKVTITATLAFLHPGGEPFELCIIGPKASKSTRGRGSQREKSRLWLVGFGPMTRWRRWRRKFRRTGFTSP